MHLYEPIGQERAVLSIILSPICKLVSKPSVRVSVLVMGCLFWLWGVCFGYGVSVLLVGTF